MNRLSPREISLRAVPVCLARDSRTRFLSYTRSNFPIRARVLTAAALTPLLLVLSLLPQGVAATPPAVVRTGTFGPLVVLGSEMTKFAVPMRLSIPRAAAARGYAISATGTFTFTPSYSDAGGKPVTPADIGVGFPGLSLTLPGESVNTAPGFDYDPGLVEVVNGKSPFTGAAMGRATLADLLIGREILRVSHTAHGGSVPAGDLDLVLKFAVKPQYFTPGSFSGAITLTVTQ